MTQESICKGKGLVDTALFFEACDIILLNYKLIINIQPFEIQEQIAPNSK
jgi:hypothetical protein